MNQELKVLFNNYIIEKKQYHTESTHINANEAYAPIIKCLIDLGINTTDDLKFEDGIRIFNWFDQNSCVKNTTKNKYMGYIKAVLRHHGYLSHPYLLVKKLPNDVEPYKPVDRELFDSIIEYAANKDTHVNDWIYYAVFVIMYDTACRIRELLTIKKQNIIISTNTIILENKDTKGRTQRFVFFTDSKKDLLRDMIKQTPSEYIFWNYSKQRKLTENDVRNYIRRIKKKLNIDVFHPHQVRKLSATDLVVAGANLKTAQTILGHKEQKTTELYINYTALVAKQEYDKFRNNQKSSLKK
ncbi:Tyrosine recombinase XerC [Acholeplasma oculi]|uniref:Integrase n=1 Tax=Acholeplasma oculi TaxID=35623 RepID=A0A061ACA2_9MOLU|nr:site-specific integrase [Acholeplasma oculi]CDR31039.1 Integrase [Acholeplasma oculi]SKC36602.1 integrase/recombinase XerC [Acholeplasma oculi]SUT90579.1 Tyrosine recombinase XerC [Acholeplasma oculi]